MTKAIALVAVALTLTACELKTPDRVVEVPIDQRIVYHSGPDGDFVAELKGMCSVWVLHSGKTNITCDITTVGVAGPAFSRTSRHSWTERSTANQNTEGLLE